MRFDAVGETGGKRCVADGDRGAQELWQKRGVVELGADSRRLVEFVEQWLGLVRLSLGEQQAGGRGKRDGHGLRLVGMARGGDEIVRSGDMVNVAAFSEQAQVERASLYEVDVVRGLQAVGDRLNLGQCLLGLAKLGKKARSHGGDGEHDLGDAPSLAELDPLSCGLARREWPLVRPAGDRHVDVEDAGHTTLTLLERELKCTAHVVDPLTLPQVTAGCATKAERTRRLGQAELGGERKCLLGGCERFRVGGTDVAQPRQLRICGD